MALSPTSSRGAAAVTTREQISGNAVTVANAGSAALTWNNVSGTALLSLAAPATPTVVAAGIYAVTVKVAAITNMTAGGYFTGLLEMDVQNDDALVTLDSPAAGAVLRKPMLTICLVYYVPAGGEITCRVTNNDGVSSIDFVLAAVVQRLS